jgi:hypothetical protein
MKQIYFKASFTQHEAGVNDIWFDEWQVIHETKCFVYCVPNYINFSTGSYYDSLRNESENDYQLAKRLNLTVKKIHKEKSRFAFASKELAFERLKFIKGYHVRHLRYQLKMVEQFLADSHGKSYAEYEPTGVNYILEVIK